jgi:deoxyadenosine/deoxycytidine kinase
MIVVIDGNIGCGKSSVLDGLAKNGYIVHKEPIDMWPLNEFYSDRRRWALTLQVAVFDSMKSCDGVHERCPESSFHVFWDMLRTDVKPIEDSIVAGLYESIGWNPDIYVYLRSSPEKCFERIQARNQTGDTEVTLEYLKQLHQQYEKFFSERPHVLIDADRPFEEVLLSALTICRQSR